MVSKTSINIKFDGFFFFFFFGGASLNVFMLFQQNSNNWLWETKVHPQNDYDQPSVLPSWSKTRVRPPEAIDGFRVCLILT